MKALRERGLITSEYGAAIMLHGENGVGYQGADIQGLNCLNKVHSTPGSLDLFVLSSLSIDEVRCWEDDRAFSILLSL